MRFYGPPKPFYNFRRNEETPNDLSRAGGVAWTTGSFQNDARLPKAATDGLATAPRCPVNLMVFYLAMVDMAYDAVARSI